MHHQLNGDEFEQSQGDDKGQGSLACCSPWGLKESDMTQQLNNKNNDISVLSPHQQNLKNTLIINEAKTKPRNKNLIFIIVKPNLD